MLQRHRTCASRSPLVPSRSACDRARPQARDPAPSHSRRPTWLGTGGSYSTAERSIPFAFQCSTSVRCTRQSTRPTISSTVRKPSSAIILRRSSATKKKKLITCSGCPWNFLRSSGILRRDANRASIQMALAHHDAAHGNQRRGREAKLLRAQQRGDGHVAAGLQFAVHLQPHAAAQIVEHQHLLRLRKAQAPTERPHAESS